MALQHEDHRSTQQRSHDYVVGSTLESAGQESGKAAVQAALSELEQAEQDLKAAHNRLGRLRWELAKAREESL